MGAKIQAFDIFQTPLSFHFPLPLIKERQIDKQTNIERKKLPWISKIVINASEV